MTQATTLTEADDGKTVDVDVGDTLMLRLPENPTTGYRWSFDALDTAVVAMQEDEHVRPSDAPGGGGDMTWKLSPVTAGRTEIKLKLWRHWAGDSSIRKRFAVTLNIRP